MEKQQKLRAVHSALHDRGTQAQPEHTNRKRCFSLSVWILLDAVALSHCKRRGGAP